MSIHGRKCNRVGWAREEAGSKILHIKDFVETGLTIFTLATHGSALFTGQVKISTPVPVRVANFWTMAKCRGITP